MKLIICGPGTCGKDLAANWLHRNTRLRFYQSTSAAAAEVCYQCLRNKYSYKNAAEAWGDRRYHRKEWADIIACYNQPDGLTLYRDMLKIEDILVGIRRKAELDAVLTAFNIDLVIWIERDVPADTTLDITAKDADIIVDNNGTPDDLFQHLSRLADALSISTSRDN